MGEFLDYMPEQLREKVKGFEGVRIEVEKAFLELDQKAKQTLGEKVRRQGSTLAFSIEGKDPRWSDVFGPKWPDLVKQNPGEPRFFYVNLRIRMERGDQDSPATRGMSGKPLLLPGSGASEFRHTPEKDWRRLEDSSTEKDLKSGSKCWPWEKDRWRSFNGRPVTFPTTRAR